MASLSRTVRSIIQAAWPFAIFIGVIVFIISFVQENWVAVAVAIGIVALGVLGRQWLQRD